MTKMTLTKTAIAGVTLGSLLAVLVLFPGGAVAGDFCARNRAACYGATYYSPGYYQPPIYNYQYQPYYPPHYDYLIKTVEVPVAPSYYYDSSSAYRDNLLADAIAYRVLLMQNGQSRQVPLQPQQAPPEGYAKGTGQEQPAVARGQGPPLAIPTAVDPKLQKVVDESCAKCHVGISKGGVSLANLATTPAGVRWAAHGLISSGEMPQLPDGKAGKPLTDEELRLFYDWARSASGKTASR